MEVATRAIPQAVLYGSLLIVYYTVNLLPVVLSGIGRASHSGFFQCNSWKSLDLEGIGCQKKKNHLKQFPLSKSNRTFKIFFKAIDKQPSHWCKCKAKKLCNTKIICIIWNKLTIWSNKWARFLWKLLLNQFVFVSTNAMERDIPRYNDILTGVRDTSEPSIYTRYKENMS